METVESGWNVLAGVDREKITKLVRDFSLHNSGEDVSGDGKVAKKIITILEEKT